MFVDGIVMKSGKIEYYIISVENEETKNDESFLELSVCILHFCLH